MQTTKNGSEELISQLLYRIYTNKYEKLLRFYAFQHCVFFIQRIQVSDTKIGRPKKIAGNLLDPKK